jgi:hypothetical protein
LAAAQMQALATTVLLGVLVTGCATVGEDDFIEPDLEEGLDTDAGGKSDDWFDSGWVSVGRGVAYQKVSDQPGILIAYGGYSARINYSAAWATELVNARLGEAGIGHIYAVQGPQDPGYAAQEIGNSKIRPHLLTYDDGTAPIFVVAHSSGAFVAHEFLRQLNTAGRDDILARIAYSNLDGGGSGFSTAIANKLGALQFVYAKDPALSSGLSQNNGAAKSLFQAYRGAGATLFEVNVRGTGCQSGAGWCLHDVVITHKPHNPARYDLARDYTNFTDRAVTIEYLEPLIVP